MRHRPLHIEPGAPTAVPHNVAYRLGKLVSAEPLAGRWLDCGCAGGGYSAALLSRGAERVVGIEAEQDRLWHAPSIDHVAFTSGIGEQLPFEDDAFDGVLLNEVLEHVADEQATLKEILRVLRGGGRLALMSPNRWFPFEGHGMIVAGRRIDVPIPLLPWLPMRLARHVMRARNYWPDELVGLVKQAGFTIETSGPVFPVFEVFPWLPGPVITVYRRSIPVLERLPVTRQFGVSTLILARKPRTEIRPDSRRIAANQAVSV